MKPLSKYALELLNAFCEEMGATWMLADGVITITLKKVVL